ncbi:MAG: translesion error-prone DNA polymerase V autoproteolytic subunit [Chlamydiia bacterium]|nr:translesion error-prone DNA polymerase V autoproteolytic subunit [Chlamydiia bacterium]
MTLAFATVEAGFPSPADDFIEKKLDLHEMMVPRPAATFFVRVSGESMVGAGIHPGDLLVVDRSLSPGHGKIIVALVDGDFTVKRLIKGGNGYILAPENHSYCSIELTPDMDFQVWGVVTYVIHRAR